MNPAASEELFRQAWGGFPSGVSVITFYEESGTVHGLTASAVCSVSLEPLLVLVCVDHKARSFPMLQKSERFVMNVLSRGQREPASYFARSDTEGEVPFRVRRSRHGLPVLEGCLAYMDCKIANTHEAGDHTIFLGQVEEIEVYDGTPLVFYTGKYTEVVPPQG